MIGGPSDPRNHQATGPSNYSTSGLANDHVCVRVPGTLGLVCIVAFLQSYVTSARMDTCTCILTGA